MKDQEWMMSVEKKLMSIKKDVEFIKDRLPICEKKEIISMIKVNRWIISVLFTSACAIIGNILAK